LLGGVPSGLVGGLELEAAAALGGGNVGGRRLGALHQLRKLLQEGVLAGQKVMVLQLRLAVVELLLTAAVHRVWVVVVVHQLPRRANEVRHEPAAGDVVVEPRRAVGHSPHGRHSLLEHPADHPSFLLNHHFVGQAEEDAFS